MQLAVGRVAGLCQSRDFLEASFVRRVQQCEKKIGHFSRIAEY